MGKRSGKNGPKIHYVRLDDWLMRTEAWKSLDTVARCAYVEIKSRYAGPGQNNGRIPYSLLEMARALLVSKATALRALKRLQDRGFVVLTARGAFSVKIRRATEWRLTECACDVTGNLATKDFVRWRPQKQNTVSQENLTGVVVKPDGCRSETDQTAKEPIRLRDGTREIPPRFHHATTSKLPGDVSSAMAEIAAAVRGAR